MRNDSQRSGDGGSLVPIPGRGNNGIIPSSFKALSSYVKIVSSGASTVASTVRSAASAASAVVEKDVETNHYQVSWAGFDVLELERGITRQVLLLGFSYGFQVWDVEVVDNVHNLVSRNDGPVSFLQMLPKPLSPNKIGDRFAESRPLLIVCADGSFSGDINNQEGSVVPSNESTKHCNESVKGSYVPTVVWFYSLRSQSYVHLLRFRSIVHLVRCSPRVVAVLQSAQIHCLNAATLEKEYTILINPITPGCFGFGNIGVGPLAVGPRWMAYSGSPVAFSNSRSVAPQHLAPSSFPGHASNGSLVAHYARESSKHLAAGIVSLGDMGFKKLSRYYSELVPDGNNCHPGAVRVKMNGVANGHSQEADNVGMVIVRDIVSKTVVAQFRAHKSSIQSLRFDPSGTLLVTASVQGHNINVFRVMPGSSEAGASYSHLYRLQRGFTNAVIQDISFSSNSRWIIISSSRGTSHLFAISPSGGSVSFQLDASRVRLQVIIQQTICSSGPPLTLSAVSRIRSGSTNGWINTVSDAASAATGRPSSLSGAIASAFREGQIYDTHGDLNSVKKNYYLLVFSQSGCVMQYAIRFPSAYIDQGINPNHDPDLDHDARLMVEAMQKWNICQKQNWKEQGDSMEANNGANVKLGMSKIYPENMKSTDNNVFPDVFGVAVKEKMSSEEKHHHMYISEAELQMHQNKNLLWARPEIYFQTMVADGSEINDKCGGEIEIERVPTRMLEARSKDLVPIFDYLQSPKFLQGRFSVINDDNSGKFQPLGSDVSDGGSLDSVANGGLIENEMDNDENGQNGWFFETNAAVVDTNDTLPIANTELKTVNTNDSFTVGGQVSFVNNRDGLGMENHFGESDKV
ncbi:Autophagy-related protein 18f [Striga hermonthica]|uniref:Autophagy-related protein 18f n=1 Tax=Striga hermonthica TaxID=68872 RepID=A0A9N7R3X3_STRHE|nr:Autophagy-related protein 18f [Striga hermonthica]